MFMDKATIHVKSGDGGNGVVRFRREKYVPAGGPAGGDGGNGGNVILQVDTNQSTLIDFKYKRHYKAESGEHGQSSKKAGISGNDLVIKVPPGTIVQHSQTKEVIADLVALGQRLLIAEGGKGGRGNTHFATSTRQAPAFAEKGQLGKDLWIELELKLIADVGLVGYPNAGKSTLISVISAAKPKIASYPFTTLVPNLGVVSLDTGFSYVVADIPGLIEGAHEGVGLGTEFLRHVERTRIIVHVIDAAGVEGRDPVDDYYQINKELRLFNDKLSMLPQVVVANKIDLPDAAENIERIREVAKENGNQFLAVSAVTTEGLADLAKEVGRLLKEIKDSEPSISEETAKEAIVYRPQEERAHVRDFKIRKHNEVFIVEGKGLEQLMQRLDLDNEETIQYLQRLFEKIGLYSKLKEMGIPEGATVQVGELEFEYYE